MDLNLLVRRITFDNAIKTSSSLLFVSPLSIDALRQDQYPELVGLFLCKFNDDMCVFPNDEVKLPPDNNLASLGSNQSLTIPV
jgi:hypothetical protein